MTKPSINCYLCRWTTLLPMSSAVPQLCLSGKPVCSKKSKSRSNMIMSARTLAARALQGGAMQPRTQLAGHRKMFDHFGRDVQC